MAVALDQLLKMNLDLVMDMLKIDLDALFKLQRKERWEENG